MRRGPGRSRHFRLEELAPGVWAAIARFGAYGLCNSTIVDLGATTVVFDSMLTPMAGADLARVAERITGRRPDFVVNSHWHGDHVRGNGAFVGAHIVSTRATRRAMATRGVRQWVDDRRTAPKELRSLNAHRLPMPRSDEPMFRGWFEGIIATPRSFRLTLPDLLIDQELVLEGSERSLRVITYGGGHSPSDVFGYLPDERIAVMGDLTMVRIHPSLSDGFPAEWIRILERVGRLRIDRLVPGHGEVGSRADLTAGARYIQDLGEIVGALSARERTPRALARVAVPPRYADWKFSWFFGMNLAKVASALPRRTGTRRRP